MSNITQGVAAEVLVGSARLLVAPLGTTLPTLDGTVDPVVWDAAFKEVGYTEDGVTMAYNPTVKDIMVDEVMAPIRKLNDGEKCTIGAKLAQSTLENIGRGISASTWTHHVADGTHAEYATLEVGSGQLAEFIIGVEGLAPNGYQRIIIAYRGMAQSNVSLTFKRSDKVLTPVEFGLLADSTKDPGKQLFIMYDKLAPHS
jgi:hypothetical protein